MKKISILYSILFPLSLFSQTLIYYDNIESYNWSGSGWSVGSSTFYYNNASVSPGYSAVIVGNGTGSSAYETGTYILSNVTGLNSSSSYTFKFRAGSYKFSSPSSATAGVDAGDYFDVQYSVNGGSSYVTEKRITGFNNSFWNYNSSGSSFKLANGTISYYTPSVGGDRTNTGDGYSTITLVLPMGITQCAFRIVARSNSSGEEWWFDNFELWEETPVSLPVELTSFSARNLNDFNFIEWSTFTENNNDYFTIERSSDGINWESISEIDGSGNSTSLINYTHLDFYFKKNSLNYYRLSQTDFDGNYKIYPIISVDNRGKESIDKILDLTGREVDGNYKGWVVVYLKNGDFFRSFQY